MIDLIYLASQASSYLLSYEPLVLIRDILNINCSCNSAAEATYWVSSWARGKGSSIMLESSQSNLRRFSIVETTQRVTHRLAEGLKTGWRSWMVKNLKIDGKPKGEGTDHHPYRRHLVIERDEEMEREPWEHQMIKSLDRLTKELECLKRMLDDLKGR